MRATLYASALGLYEIEINGTRVGDALLKPGWSDYRHRVYYQTCDVTGLLREGENAIGAILADGWYAGYLGHRGKRGYYGVAPRLIAQLEIECADGSVITIGTDPTWKAATGPHLEADLLMGETYDARRAMPGWSSPGHDDSAWARVTVAEGVTVRLRGMLHAPIRKTGEIRPVRSWSPRAGCHVFDMGQNFAGWVRLKVDGAPGTRIVIRFGERLDRDGTVYRANLRGARATDTYVCAGRVDEWEPRFTYHGFQYVEMTGYPGTPGLDAVTGVVAHSAAPMAGEFECSAALVNTLHRNIVWTQRANFVDVPTDCPQRDERLGWLGDAQIFARTATSTMDVEAFFAKWLVDVADAQSDDGVYPEVAPRWPEAGAGTPGWADAGIICPWVHYTVYGDRRIIEAHYDAMKRWVEYVSRANPDHLWTRHTGANFGDWLAIDEGTPKSVLATAYFARSAALLARMARIIEKREDAARYERLLEGITAAFNRAYVSADGRVAGETQTCYAIALHFDLLPESLRHAAAARLHDAIAARDDHLSTGFHGTACLLPALSATGRLDTAYRLLMTETFPSWGYSIRHGATSLWERWDSWTEEHGFQDPRMNSFCHYAFGSVGEWLVSTVAGIDTDGPGFKRIIIQPRPGGGLTWARARYDSVKGPIATHWSIEDGAFLLDVTIPANTTARIFLPARDAESVSEAGRPVREVEEVEVTAIENGSLVLRVGSGTYRFRVRT